MGLAGRVVGTLFFVALIVGALTSAISLLEVVVSSAMDGLGWERSRSALVFGGAITVLGAFSAFNIEVLDVSDQIANNILLLGGGFAPVPVHGWFMKDPIAQVLPGSKLPACLPPWLALVRFAAPLVLAFVPLAGGARHGDGREGTVRGRLKPRRPSR